MIFTIPGAAVPQGRPRFTRTGHAYTPQKSREYRTFAQACIRKAMNAEGWERIDEGGIDIYIQEYRSIPASWSKKKQSAAIDGLIYPTSKPDLDNVVKAVKDAMNGLVWRDDAQVVCIRALKKYTQGEPKVVVEIFGKK